MRMAIFLIGILYITSLHAQEVTVVEKGDLHFSKAQSELISVTPICPNLPGRISCRAIGSVIKIRVTLNACLDRLGGHFSRFEVNNGKGILYFGAINIFNESSTSVRCVRLPTEMVTVSIPFDGDIELVPLEFKGTTFDI